MAILQIMAGVILGLGTILAVFWITFRQPPSRRPDDSTTSIGLNSEADALARTLSEDGHGGFS